MKKNIFILIAVLFFLTMTSSCSDFFNKLEEENITFILPRWPDNSSYNYPTLSRWKINIECENYSIEKYIPATKDVITITVKKNKPLSITAQPVTMNSSSKETLFFKPAGFIYPYETIENSNYQGITWQGGFLASIMNELFKSININNLEPDKVNNFIINFNWKKAADYINENSLNNENYYNPWLINKDNLMKKLTDKNFSSTYLRSSYTYQKDITSLALPNILSAYIPENKIIKETGQILIKKDDPLMFYINKDKGILFTLDSSKKLSQQFVFIPIFIEEL